ncbi:HNH endonuclease, partial [Streptomyces sp. P17]|nr:HNH endonuclease [Streptomyces sp. P17]
MYSKERLTKAVAEARNWADLLRRLDLRASGGKRRVLQKKVAGYGLDTSHFVKRSPWRKYPDATIAEAAASSSSLREAALGGVLKVPHSTHGARHAPSPHRP